MNRCCRHYITNGRNARKDPSRTLTLRKQFERDLSVRFNKLKKAIIKLIVEEDALGLKPPAKLHLNTRWKFHTSEQKLNAFRNWIKTQISLHLIKEVSEASVEEDSWWNKYIMEGFKKGASRAFEDSRPPVNATSQEKLDFYNGTRAEFLRSSFNHPVSRDRVKLLASRTFTDLKGVTDSMAAQMSHTLVDGLTKGDNPLTIARELSKVTKVSKSRAQRIARTEIIRTHAEGQLQAFENLGITHVGVMAEWATAHDDKVCPLCKPLDGVVMKVEEARGLLPRHPNCRCAWLPSNIIREKDKKKSKSDIQKAIEASYKAGGRKGESLEDIMKRSSWGAADKTIDKVRPKAAVDIERKG